MFLKNKPLNIRCYLWTGHRSLSFFIAIVMIVLYELLFDISKFRDFFMAEENIKLKEKNTLIEWNEADPMFYSSRAIKAPSSYSQFVCIIYRQLCHKELHYSNCAMLCVCECKHRKHWKFNEYTDFFFNSKFCNTIHTESECQYCDSHMRNLI